MYFSPFAILSLLVIRTKCFGTNFDEFIACRVFVCCGGFRLRQPIAPARTPKLLESGWIPVANIGDTP